MVSRWYTGRTLVHQLTIESESLEVIHTDAFNCFAFSKLQVLKLAVRNAMIHYGAVNGLDHLHVFRFRAKNVVYLPINLFAPTKTTIEAIEIHGWPNNVGLDELFGDEVFYRLLILHIQDVQMPQSKFRSLTASNFTSMRHLFFITLQNCGIETIDQHTFDAVGRTLNVLILSGNRIKSINLDMFRVMFETNKYAVVRVLDNAVLDCSCDVIEVDLMQYPMREMAYIKCRPNVEQLPCEAYQVIIPNRLCVKWEHGNRLRYFDIQMAFVQDAFLLETYFGHRIRVIFIDSMALRAKRCADRVSKMCHKCLSIDEATERLPLNDVMEIRDVEFVVIAVVPVVFQFGICPFHLITVHRSLEPEPWLEQHGWILFQVVFIVLSASIIGWGTVVGTTLIWYTDNALPENDLEMTATEYSPYNYPQVAGRTRDEQSLDPYYSPYAEVDDGENYIEITDTGYMAAF